MKPIHPQPNNITVLSAAIVVLSYHVLEQSSTTSVIKFTNRFMISYNLIGKNWTEISFSGICVDHRHDCTSKLNTSD